MVHAGLSGSPWLVLVAVASLPFPVPWDGAGDAGMAGVAPLRRECSVYLPLGLTALSGCKLSQVPHTQRLFQDFGSGLSFPVPGG